MAGLEDLLDPEILAFLGGGIDAASGIDPDETARLLALFGQGDSGFANLGGGDLGFGIGENVGGVPATGDFGLSPADSGLTGGEDPNLSVGTTRIPPGLQRILDAMAEPAAGGGSQIGIPQVQLSETPKAGTVPSIQTPTLPNVTSPAPADPIAFKPTPSEPMPQAPVGLDRLMPQRATGDPFYNARMQLAQDQYRQRQGGGY